MVFFLPMIPSILMVKTLTFVESYLDYPDVITLLILVMVGGLTFSSLMLVIIAATRIWTSEYDFIFGLLKKMRPSAQRG